MARLILDTGVLVHAARGRIDVTTIFGTDDVAIPAIAMAEFLVGVELDANAVRAARERDLLEQVLATIVVEDYTAAVAPHHAALLAHTRRRSGRPRSAHDLIIAATARATDRELLTTNGNAGFDELPGVRCRVLAG